MALSPDRSVSTAAQVLTGMGWSVLLSDAPAGILRAEHQAVGDGNGDWIACENGYGRRGDTRYPTKRLMSTISIHLVARPDTGGSVAQISANALGSATALLGRTPIACVSSGRIERALADSLRARSGS